MFGITLTRAIGLLLFFLEVSCYIEFQLTRLPTNSARHPGRANQCQDPKTIDNLTQYQQICIEKDIAYTIDLQSHPTTYKVAIDMTTPISWIKGESCTIIGSSQKCKLIQMNLAQKINYAIRHKVTQLVKKLKMRIAEEESDSAIIEGSNQIVMGSPQKLINSSVTAKNTDHVNQFLDILMLGLFLIGQQDVITLNQTTFLRANQISSNLDSLCDGALSLRLDANSQNSYLNELFSYLKSKDKIISVYLGERIGVMTVGSYERKYLRNGVTDLKRIKIAQDQTHGKMPQLQGLILSSKQLQDNYLDDNSSVLFTLSSSSIAFPKDTLRNFISRIPKSNNCKLMPYLECSFQSTKALQQFVDSSLSLDFDSSMIGLQVRELLLERERKRVRLNIKQSLSNYTVLGQPFFKKYYTYFDYDKNEMGFAERALSIQQSFIETVTLIHLVVLLLLFVICFVLSSEKFKNIYYECFQIIVAKARPSLNRIQQVYKPIRYIGQARQQSGPTVEDDLERI